MLTEIGASNDMFAEAMDKAADTPGYQRVIKIIESVDSYELFAKMMRKKNAALNEAALKLLLQQENKESSVPTKGFEKGKF
jgi:hypothetical protein